MTITFFGIVWLLILAIIAYVRDLENMVALLIFSMVLQCDNVVLFGEKGIGPQLITSVYFCFFHFLVPERNIVRKDFLSKPFIILLFLLCCYIGINAVIHRTLSQSFNDIIIIYVYLFTSICLYRVRKSISSKQIWNIIKKLYLFLLIVGVLQFLATTHIIPKFLLSELLYNDNSDVVYFNTKGIYARITSTFMEPSYFSGLLCGLIGISIYNKKLFKYSCYSYIYVLVGIIELILTFSTTAYLTFVCVLIALVIIDQRQQNLLKYLPFMSILFLFVVITWDTLISEIIVNKLESNSGVERHGWDLIAFEAFLNNPFFGVGYISVRASSVILTILANLGLVGLFLYLVSLFSCFLFVFVKRIRNNSLSISARLILFSVLISQIIACPDLSLCTFWLSVYLVVITDTIDKNKADLRMITYILRYLKSTIYTSEFIIRKSRN